MLMKIFMMIQHIVHHLQIFLKHFLENHGFTTINIAPFLVDKSEFFGNLYN